MPTNLREKLSTLLDDVKSLNKQDALNRMERFVLDEMKFLETEHLISKYDLNTVRSMAHSTFLAIDPRSLSEHGYDMVDEARAWSYLNAAVQLLKSKGLTACTIKYDNKRK